MSKPHLLTICLLLLGMVNYALAQSLQERFDACKAAYTNGDYSTYLTEAKVLDSMRPNHPVILTHLARAQVIAGSFDQAALTLKRMVLSDADLALKKDSVWQLLPIGHLEKLYVLQAETATEVRNGQLVFSLNDKDLHPEGLVRLSEDRYLVGSIRQRKILNYDAKIGTVEEDWLALPDMLAVMGMQVDTIRNKLWIAMTSIPEMTGYDPDKLAQHGRIWCIDLATKQVERKIELPEAWPGDIAVHGDGNVYATSSLAPIIWKISTNGELTEFVHLKSEALNLQGLSFDHQGRYLFVADYIKGILRIELSSGDLTWLTESSDFVLKGIDGLYYYDNSLVAIHNGVNPNRVVRYMLNADHTAITGYQMLDKALPEMNEPTLGTIHGNTLYYVINSPWQAYGQDKKFDSEKARNPMVFKVRLN